MASSWRNILGSYGPGGGGPLAADLGVPSSGAGSHPGTGPDGINRGQLEPNSRARNMDAGVPYQLVPVVPPFVRIANDPNIVYFYRSRTVTFFGNGVAAGTAVTNQIQFSVPTVVVARTAAAVLPVGTNFDVGRNALDSFLVQFFRAGSSSDLIDAGGGGATNPSAPVLGSALLGPASLPAYIPGNGLFFDTGSFLNISAQSLIISLTAHITIHCIEEYGPARG